MIRAGVHYVFLFYWSLIYCLYFIGLYFIVFILLSLFYCHFLILK
jgi:hypothetical protein